jgi:hypothetical protein
LSEDARDDLRSTSEDLLASTEELAAIERRKLDDDTSRAELVCLSERAVDLTRKMARKAEIQQKVAAQADGQS